MVIWLPAACDIVGPAPAAIARLEIISGDAQAAPVTEVLPRDLVVRAVDSLGAPIPNAALIWGSDSGTTIEGDTVADPQGYARATWTLGSVAGERSAWVSAQMARGVQATFAATAQPGPIAHLQQVRPAPGTDLSVAEGNLLPDSLVIRVTDALGNGVRGVRVDWRVTKGGGTIRSPLATTNAQGFASAAWQVGIALPNVVVARVGADSIEFRASPTLLSPRDTIRLPSTLKYLDIRVPTDAITAAEGSTVAVYYSEYLLDGTLLQRVRNGVDAPLRFTLGADGVIAGFNEGVSGMRRGAIRRLVVPPALGYNDGVVRVYDVELAEVR